MHCLWVVYCINIVAGLYITNAMTYLLSRFVAATITTATTTAYFSNLPNERNDDSAGRAMHIIYTGWCRPRFPALLLHETAGNRERRGKEITTRWIRCVFDTVFHFYRARQRFVISFVKLSFYFNFHSE
uniref:Secreted protein n=1 Tax=Trichogramma kaykai TaxID=54128 RepID=A0ABD2XFQ0_9HYME